MDATRNDVGLLVAAYRWISLSMCFQTFCVSRDPCVFQRTATAAYRYTLDAQILMHTPRDPSGAENEISSIGRIWVVSSLSWQSPSDLKLDELCSRMLPQF